MALYGVDFGFGFNDSVFSNRVLHIELIEEDSVESQGGCIKDSDKEDYIESQGGCIISDGENPRKDSDKENQVKTLHVNSLILAAKSPFFRKLFLNGMRESQQRDITLRIDASENAPLMDVINFMYSNTLSSSTSIDLIGVLIVADKFEVISCTRYCIELLQKKMPMSLDSALAYIELPASILGFEGVQPLLDTAKEYLVARYSDFNTSKKEMMELPLCAIEVVLGSHDGIQDDLKADIFDFIFKWVRAHYPKLEDRSEILTKRLTQCIVSLSPS